MLSMRTVKPAAERIWTQSLARPLSVAQSRRGLEIVVGFKVDEDFRYRRVALDQLT
jgi:hypothetical protein